MQWLSPNLIENGLIQETVELYFLLKINEVIFFLPSKLKLEYHFQVLIFLSWYRNNRVFLFQIEGWWKTG